MRNIFLIFVFFAQLSGQTTFAQMPIDVCVAHRITAASRDICYATAAECIQAQTVMQQLNNGQSVQISQSCESNIKACANLGYAFTLKTFVTVTGCP